VVACPAASAAAQSPSDVPALDPSKNATYAAVAAVLEAIAGIFPDEYLHLGADEVLLWLFFVGWTSSGIGECTTVFLLSFP
jgi:N-acetyl-beta-hexosaminidase